VSYTGLDIAHYEEIEILPERYVGRIDRALLKRFVYPSFFPRLQYYELVPVVRST
jgi:hypothetical protein